MSKIKRFPGGHKAARVGWIIGDQLSRSPFFHRVNVKIGGVSAARYNWMAGYVNSNHENGLRYEIYRPWKRYDVLLFLKSMGDKSVKLIEKRRAKGCKSIFDINVNYFESDGNEYYRGMLPTKQHKKEAIAITQTADGVIADSGVLAEAASKYNSDTIWIPDNVDMSAVPGYSRWSIGKTLPLLWSGEAVKLFELLSIESALRRYSGKIKLILVTNSLKALDRWHPGYKARLKSLLDDIDHEIIPYQSVENLLKMYARGGIVISPRYLDNTYNRGHTEWKITLAMACGRMALASPVPSYVDVHSRSEGKGIRILRTPEQWEEAFDDILTGITDIEAEERGARKVVDKYYSTSVIAEKHMEYVKHILDLN